MISQSSVVDRSKDIGWRVQFILLSAIWGASFLFIKVLDRHWPALWIALTRVILGAATLVLLMWWRGERLRFERRVWLHLVVAAAFFNAIPFTLFAYGETKVPSVVAGLWNSTTPLWTLIFVLLVFSEEHPDRDRVIGLLVGFLGATILLGPWRGLGGGQWLGHLACAAAAACYGVGFLYTRRYLAGRGESVVGLAAGQLLCATLILALFAPLARAPTIHIGIDGLGSILALGVLGTGIASLPRDVISAARPSPFAGGGRVAGPGRSRPPSALRSHPRARSTAASRRARPRRARSPTAGSRRSPWRRPSRPPRG